MEIERKFLIKEKTKIYPCPFNVEELKKEIKKKGKKIIQYYLPIEILPEIKKLLNLKIRFEPSEIRVKKDRKKYSLTVKSDGTIKRSEFEKTIPKEIFEILSKLSESKIEKLKLKKILGKHELEFNYIKEKALIICEIEFKDLKDAKKFKTNMKEITNNKNYKNRNLSR